MKDYNELFELAKDLHSEAKSDKDVKSLELIERLFPQLKETEEEKTLADLKKLVCARADSRDIERFIKFLSRVTPVFTDKEESFCEHILPRIVNNPFEWSSEQGRADREYLKEFIDGIKGRFVAKYVEEDNDNEVSATNDKILSTMLSHFKAKTKSEWCGLKVRDIVNWLENKKNNESNYSLDLDNASQDYVNGHFCQGADFTPGYIKGLMEDAFVNGANWQKEQKPNQSEEEREYVKTIKRLVFNLIRSSCGGIFDVAYYHRICDWLDGRHIEQKEQKPMDECNTHEPTLDEVIANPERYGLRKPAEWSEREGQKSLDETVKDIIKDKDSAKKFLKSAGIINEKGELSDIYREEHPIYDIDVLKKHITRDSLSSEVNKRLIECGWYVTDEKPAELSEEDSAVLAKIIFCIHTQVWPSTEEQKSFIDFLKSLIPHKELKKL